MFYEFNNIIFCTTKNFPVTFWKSVWGTFSESCPEETKFLPTGEPDISKNKLSTIYTFGVSLVSLSYKTQWFTFPAEN